MIDMKIHDISPLLSEDIDVWPGDVPFVGRKSLEIAKGHNIDLGSMTTTFHAGAHVDAPNHYHKDGSDAASMDLDSFYGDCQVIEVEVGRGRRIYPHDVGVEIDAPRVLFHTDTFEDPESWNNDFAALSAELVDWLADQGVILVGIDTPSIDLFDDKVLEAHQRVAARGMVNLEGIVLHGVRPGVYTLCAFPLKIRHADASPVRAVLIEDE
jgi:arylformamidase